MSAVINYVPNSTVVRLAAPTSSAAAKTAGGLLCARRTAMGRLLGTMSMGVFGWDEQLELGETMNIYVPG